METVFLFGKPQATGHRARGPRHPIFEKPLPQQRRTAAQRTEMPPLVWEDRTGTPPGAAQSSGTIRNGAQGHLHNDDRIGGRRNRSPPLILRTRALRRGRLRRCDGHLGCPAAATLKATCLADRRGLTDRKLFFFLWPGSYLNIPPSKVLEYSFWDIRYSSLLVLLFFSVFFLDRAQAACWVGTSGTAPDPKKNSLDLGERATGPLSPCPVAWTAIIRGSPPETRRRILAPVRRRSTGFFLRRAL